MHWPWSCFCGLEDDHTLATWSGETFRQMMLLLFFEFGTGMSPTDGNVTTCEFVTAQCFFWVPGVSNVFSSYRVGSM